MVCGARDMAGCVASVVDGIVRPIGLGYLSPSAYEAEFRAGQKVERMALH